MKASKLIWAGIPAALVLALLLLLLPVGASAATPASGNTFTFTETGVKASNANGSGFEIDGTSLKITESGVYTITGSCTEGSVTVKKGVTGVTLVLKDLTLGSSTTAPLTGSKGTETTLYIVGTVTLNDNESLENETADTFEGAAIKVKSENASLTISGTGTLNINGNCKNGLKGAATATITVESGTLNIQAANHGIAVDNELVIKGGTVNITAGDEGLKAEPDEDDTESLGNITISGGSVTVDAADDGIHAEGNLLISGGTVTVSAGDDGLKAEYDVTISGGDVAVLKSSEGIEGATVNLAGGTGRVIASDDGVNAANSDLTGYAFELNITGGAWYIDAGGDGLDSNGTITVDGGVTEVYGAANSGNAALDSERGITYKSGTLLAVGMSGMAETPASGAYVAFGASGMGGMMGGFGGGRMPDGAMGGGFGGRPEEGQMPGGMMGGPRGQMGGQRPGGATETQTQAFGGMQQNGSSISITQGSAIVIKDSSGKTLYTATGVRNADSVVFLSDELTEGETYTLYVDGSEAATGTAAAGSGMMGGGFGGGQMPGDRQQGQQPGGHAEELPGGSSGSGRVPQLANRISPWVKRPLTGASVA